jgi:hypothetical protein
LRYWSHHDPLSSAVIVCRGYKNRGGQLAPLDKSTIDEVIAWSCFTSISTGRGSVIQQFMKSEHRVLRQILLHPGHVARCIADYSVCRSKSETLIAASTRFQIDGVRYIDIEIQQGDYLSVVNILVIELSYFRSWFDVNID